MPCNDVTMVDPATNATVIKSYVAIDYNLDCDLGKHTLMRGLAWIMFFLVPIFYPLWIWYKFRQHWKNGQLWMPCTESTEDAVFDSDVNRRYIPNAEMKRDFGFLFMTYEPSFYWWEVKELFKKFFFCAFLPWLGPGGGDTSPEQLTLGFLYGMVELVFYAFFSPYPDSTDDLFSVLSQLQINLLIFYAL